MRKPKMNLTVYSDGFVFRFKRSIVGWIGEVGKDFYISIHQTGNKWYARRFRPGLGAGVEPIAIADTMRDVVAIANRIYANE